MSELRMSLPVDKIGLDDCTARNARNQFPKAIKLARG
jgi:hypothetical protein